MKIVSNSWYVRYIFRPVTDHHQVKYSPTKEKVLILLWSIYYLRYSIPSSPPFLESIRYLQYLQYSLFGENPVLVMTYKQGTGVRVFFTWLIFNLHLLPLYYSVFGMMKFNTPVLLNLCKGKAFFLYIFLFCGNVQFTSLWPVTGRNM